jgi:hypothetical protein
MSFAVMNVVPTTSDNLQDLLQAIQATDVAALQAQPGFRSMRLFKAEEGTETVMINRMGQPRPFRGVSADGGGSGSGRRCAAVASAHLVLRDRHSGRPKAGLTHVMLRQRASVRLAALPVAGSVTARLHRSCETHVPAGSASPGWSPPP